MAVSVTVLVTRDDLPDCLVIFNLKPPQTTTRAVTSDWSHPDSVHHTKAHRIPAIPHTYPPTHTPRIHFLAGTENRLHWKLERTLSYWDLVLAVSALAGATGQGKTGGDQRRGSRLCEETETYVDWQLQASVPEQHASLTGMEMICNISAERVHQPSRRR
ncbi:hypothetical protein OG21DRAFT_210818 [Imleria badia]|nr:hypothetical protein OG21DRAFT_210818 [Imleria badia]